MRTIYWEGKVSAKSQIIVHGRRLTDFNCKYIDFACISFEREELVLSVIAVFISSCNSMMVRLICYEEVIRIFNGWYDT